MTCQLHRYTDLVDEDEVRWLDPREQAVWRRWLFSQRHLMGQLTRSLAAESGLSMPDYEVLVMLTDTPEGRVRMAALADLLEWERSRLSHHIRRMEARGLVERRECQEDGRGAFVGITPLGQRTIERAAPGHVSAVRRHFIDELGPDGVDALETALGRLDTGPARL
jgi:DNA-binding MarR family transcriptional regulator